MGSLVLNSRYAFEQCINTRKITSVCAGYFNCYHLSEMFTPCQKKNEIN